MAGQPVIVHQSILSSTLGMSAHPQGQWLSPRVVNLTLQYLTVGIKQARTWKLLAPHVPALMQRVLFPLMCFGDEDAELWDDDPQEYIRKVCFLISSDSQGLSESRVMSSNASATMTRSCGRATPGVHPQGAPTSSCCVQASGQ